MSASTSRRPKPRRLYSFPPQRSTSVETDYDETDFFTANEVFPVSVPLDKVQIGSIHYISKEWNDVEVLYELESSDILIKASIEGENGEPPGMYRIIGVSAADLSLYCVVPSSLESMVSRLILELENDIVYEPLFRNPLMASVNDTAQDDHYSEIGSHSLKTRVLKMSASVHEAGHFRDILLFLKCENVADLNPEIAYLPHKVAKFGKSRENDESSESKSSQLTFLEFLPFWVIYIPWWFYSRNARTILQRIILFYYIFSVIWAMWQLYRHVDVIQFVLEPIIHALKLYLSSVFVYVDWFFCVFTEWWHFYLSPLNVLRGILVTPVIQALFQLKTVLTPFFTVVSQCLKNSAFITAFKSLSTILYQFTTASWSTLWTFIEFLGKPLSAFLGACRALGKPFSGIWQGLLNARVAVASLDFQRLRLSWVFNMLVGSFKSIGNGLAWFVGYTHKKQKRRHAMSQAPPPASTTPPRLTPEHKLRQRKMPMYYSSPLSKQK